MGNCLNYNINQNNNLNICYNFKSINEKIYIQKKEYKQYIGKLIVFLLVYRY